VREARPQFMRIKKTIKSLLIPSALLLTACGGGTDLDAPFTAPGVPAIAPALPDTEVNNAAPNDPLTKQDAFRLLEQTTFGANTKLLDALDGQTPEAWINTQLAAPATYLSAGYHASPNKRWNEYINIWWRNSIGAEDQLRQRVAFALSQIFVVSASAGLGDEQPGLASYYDVLLRPSFGNYRDLIEEITLHPIMGEYLSMKGNRKPDPDENIRPDENYARELLQLFSIGLSMLNEDGTPITDADGVPLPTYTQETVEGFAHVFTGWHFANAEDFRWPKNKDFVNPMVAWPEYHDTGEKELLNGFIVPAGQTPEQDLDAALDNIANHPNVGPFIVKQLISKLITSNPSTQYVKDVVAVFNENINGERGNLGSTIKAILMHEEARQGHINGGHTFGKTKEPLLKVTQLWRAFEPSYIHNDFNYAWVMNELKQAPLGSPSVFNFFRPDFSQPGNIRERGMLSPEFEILDESSIITITSRLLSNSVWSHNYKVAGDEHRIAINIDHEMDLESDREALLDHLDMLLLGGRMSNELRSAVSQLMDARNYSNAASQRIAEAIFLIISSPEAAVQI